MAEQEETLETLGELGLIRRIRQRAEAPAHGIVRGIGDDAAVFHLPAGRAAVLTTDMLLEGVHFRLSRGEPRRLGRKLLAVNLSDIAAMGARPLHAFLALAAPGGLALALIDEILEGFLELAARHGVRLLGGDTCASPGGLVATVTVIGEVDPGRAVYRSGARPGDLIAVTGSPGDSALGLALLERGESADDPERARLVRAHQDPEAEVEAGPWLAQCGAVSAMIDLSDGVWRDLAHLAAESGGIGARVEAERLPLSRELVSVAPALGLDPLRLALTGGEDYRLLLALTPERAAAAAAGFAAAFGRPLHVIGRMEASPGLRLAREGRVEPLPSQGFEHWAPGG